MLLGRLATVAVWVGAILAVALLGGDGARAQTCTSPSATSDSVPANPGIASGAVDAARTAAGGSTQYFKGCSEVVDLAGAMQPMSPAGGPAWPRTNCPHLEAGLANFETLFGYNVQAGADVTIAAGQRVLFRPCSLRGDGTLNPSVTLRRIRIQSGGALIFDDADITLHIEEIIVDAGGELIMGSESCRLYSNVQIMYHGSRATSELTNDNYAAGTSKGLQSKGAVDMHGKQFQPTWSRLSRPAAAGQTIVFIQDAVNWEVGQTIMLTTTVFEDCSVQWQSYCPNGPHQNEEKIIAAIELNRGTNEYAVELTTALQYNHYAGHEYQAEVVLLSRNLYMWGQATGDDFGMHQMVAGSQARGRWSGVQVENGGQLNVEARYPFHFHLLDAANSQQSYAKDCSVTSSNFRCFVVHQSNAMLLESNTAYNIKGMCYYLEDGVEEDVNLMYNFGGHVHPIFKPADGGYGQGGEQFNQQNGLLLPADTSASAFYIPNAYNTFVGNAASGGWSGFAFPNTPLPIGLAQGQDLGDRNPEKRPTKEFRGNSAHSAGFYWRGHGSCFYTGARHTYNTGSAIMQYDSGRHARSTVDGTTGQTAWMVFQDVKAFLCRKGVAHWGNQIELINFEIHDSESVAAMVFGEATLYNGLITGNSGNSDGVAQLGSVWGFQFYDTWVKIILDRVTFRGFSAQDRVIRFMDHSDQFLPQGINAVRGIKYENCDPAVLVALRRCGPQCGDADEFATTMSSKIYSIWDYDGSMVGSYPAASGKTGTPQILGSNRAWWNLGSQCAYNSDWQMYYCDWTTERQIVYTKVEIPNVMNGCDSGYGTCSGQNARYTVGTMSQWGQKSSRFVTLSPWSGVAGHGNIGWHWHPYADTPDTGVEFNGGPSRFVIKDHQISRGNFIVLSVRYPADTTFQVVLNGWGTVTDQPVPQKSLAEVTQATEVLSDQSTFVCGQWNQLCTSYGSGNAVGPAWHFDGTHLYIRVVQPHCYSGSERENCQNSYFYQFNDTKIWDIRNGVDYEITASSGASSTTVDGIQFFQTGECKAMDGGVVQTGCTSGTPNAFSEVVGSSRGPVTPMYASSKPVCTAPSSSSGTSGTSAGTTTTSGTGTTGTTGAVCVPTITACPTNATPAWCGNLDDGCGNAIPCGACQGPFDQCTNNRCVCQGQTCLQAGFECGLSDNGCNVGQLLDCSTCNGTDVCSSDQKCNPAGQTPVLTCSGEGFNCGQLQTTYQPSGAPVTFQCGQCTGQNTCVNNVCSCTPLTAAQACRPNQCTQEFDGCGGVINCGSCPIDAPCQIASGECTSFGCASPGETLVGGSCICDKPGYVLESQTGECVDESTSVSVGALTRMSAGLVALVFAFMLLC